MKQQQLVQYRGHLDIFHAGGPRPQFIFQSVLMLMFCMIIRMDFHCVADVLNALHQKLVTAALLMTLQMCLTSKLAIFIKY